MTKHTKHLKLFTVLILIILNRHLLADDQGCPTVTGPDGIGVNCTASYTGSGGSGPAYNFSSTSSSISIDPNTGEVVAGDDPSDDVGDEEIDVYDSDGNQGSMAITVVEVDFDSLWINGSPSKFYTIDYGTYSGYLDFSTVVYFNSYVTVSPSGFPANNVNLQYMQMINAAYNELMADGSVNVSPKVGPDGPMNDPQRQVTDDTILFVEDDEPGVTGSPQAYNSITSITATVKAADYLQYNIEGGQWQTIGKVEWYWYGTLNSNHQPSGGSYQQGDGVEYNGTPQLPDF